MKGVFQSLPLSFKMILKDPINLILALVPTLIALALYAFCIVTIFQNADYFGVVIQNWIPDQETAGWLGKLITAIFIIFVFLLMSWTFVLVVGILAAPFNSMLSARIETALIGKPLSQDKKKTFSEVVKSLGETFKNEFKKILLIAVCSALAFVFNLFPLFYPVGIFLLSVLFAVQFVDYSWSRHESSFGVCLKDVISNLFPYSFAGLFFIILISVPIINAFVPAWATSYFTILWLHRQKKLT